MSFPYKGLNALPCVRDYFCQRFWYTKSTRERKGADNANRPICQKALENGAGADSYMWSDVVAQVGGDDMG